MALRHTISPQFSNRPSPPITRSVSRSGSRQPFDTSTPLTRRSLQPGMHIETIERVFESADDTDVDLNSSKFVYKEHFSVKEMTSMKKEMWYDWLEYRIRMLRRQFAPSFKTVRETLMILILVSMLAKYARDCFLDEKYQHSEHIDQRTDLDTHWRQEKQKIHQSVSDLRTDFNNRLERLEFRIAHLESQSEDNKGWKESVIEELNKMKTWQSGMNQVIDSMKIDLEENKAAKIINVEEQSPEPPAPPMPSNTQLQPIQFTRRSLIGVNVANSLIGASIDHSCSSRPASAKDGIFYDVMSYLGSFKEGYVLLDRDVLSPGEAWCTYDKRATLTVKLARFIKPISVSYQHVRWSGIVPNHAPKLYDLVACLDQCCTQWEPLITNCEYKASNDGNDEQEQFCFVSMGGSISPISRVQFRFRENHGNMTKTCAYLVRVYGEPVDPPKEQQPSGIDNGTTASHLESTIVNSMSETA